MGAAPTNRAETCHYDRIFEQTLRRLQTTPDISEEDRKCVMKLVEHLLAKGVSKQRAVKYINHLIVLARIAGKPFGNLTRKTWRR